MLWRSVRCIVEMKAETSTHEGVVSDYWQYAVKTGPSIHPVHLVLVCS